MSTPYVISPLRYAFGVCAIAVAAGLAIGGLLGLAIGWPRLATLLQGLPAIKPNAAIAILMACAAWLALQSRLRSPALGLVFVGASTLIAGATLFEHVAGVDLGIDNVVGFDYGGHATGHPGRMSAAACVALLLASLSLALTRSITERAEDVRQFARLTGLAIALFAVALHAYDGELLTVVKGFEATALNTALALVFLMLAIGFDRSTASLRWQIAHIGVVVVAPLAALTVHFASSERDIALRNARERLASVAQLGAERQEALIEQSKQMLTFLARSPAVRNAGPGCQQELKSYLPFNPWLRAIFTVGRDGMVRCSDQPAMVALDLSDREYVKRTFAEGRFTVSGYYIARSTGLPRIAVSLPVIENGTAELMVSAAFDLGAFGGPIASLEREGGPWETMTLVDKYGAVMARSPSQPGVLGANLADATFVTQALANPDRPFEAAELDGRATVFAARRVLSGEGTLIVGLPKKMVVGAVDARLNRRLFLISAILAASLTLGVLGSEALVMRPLRRLISYAGRLEAGDLSARPDLRAHGEVKALGRALAVTAAAIEERERRLAETEALFRSLFDHSPDSKVVVSVDADQSFRVETWNAAASLVTGLAASDVIGKRPVDIFPGSRGLQIEQDLLRTLELGRITTVEREPVVNGLPTVFEIVQVPMRSPEGSIERIFLSARDISERKRVERLKNEFVSTVSHELRTPLTSIAGSLGLLSGGAAGPLADKAKHLIGIAHSNSLRLVRLINDILDIEKIEAGRMTFDLKTLTVSELLEQAIGGLRGYADEFGVEIGVAPGGCDLMVRGDADRLTQVFTNLLSNAIKFSPRGEAVTVAIRPDGDVVTIAVRDRGPGIPEAFRPRLFSKFAQADGSDSRRKGGTGLGLAIVREIVERHAGAVSYRTEIGVGTEFEVRLPRHKAPDVGSTALRADALTRRPTVMICEDDSLVAAILAEQLGDAGFAAIAVGTVQEALQTIENEAIDAALVDLNLPDGDGVGLIRRLRATTKGRTLPIVVVSAEATRRSLDPAAAPLDVAAWLEKPVDTRRIAALLQQGLRGGSARARILHVEDDPDLCNVVSAAIAPLADVVSTPSLAGARLALDQAWFDLAIVDVKLEDGSGLDLLSALDGDGRPAIPAIVFSASDIDRDAAPTAQTAITKSRTSLSALVDAVRRLIAERKGGSEDRAGAPPRDRLRA